MLAAAGVASRRAADRLVEEGRVRVNGRVVREAGLRVDPGRDAIEVDGKRIGARPAAPVYLMLHKPRAVVTTLADPQGRRTVRDLLPPMKRRVFPVGRLDYHSEGLLLLTDDGDLARDLMHPSRGVPKTYRVKVRGTPTEVTLERLRRGIPLDGRRARATRVRRTGAHGPRWLELTVVEGRKHLVRRLLAAVGHPVQKLRRIAYGGVHLGRLAPGGIRPLTASEVARLRGATRAGDGAGGRRPERRN